MREAGGELAETIGSCTALDCGTTMKNNFRILKDDHFLFFFFLVINLGL